MKTFKILVFILCFCLLTTIAWSADCDNSRLAETVTRYNCTMLTRMEANQKQIIEDQKKIKAALEFLIQMRIPHFNIETLKKAGD